jgi:hypothetical protein
MEGGFVWLVWAPSVLVQGVLREAPSDPEQGDLEWVLAELLLVLKCDLDICIGESGSESQGGDGS